MLINSRHCEEKGDGHLFPKPACLPRRLIPPESRRRQAISAISQIE